MITEREERLTLDRQMSDTRDLAGLVPGDTLVCSLVLREGSRDGESMNSPLRLHLEVLGRLDHLAVVVPLNDGVWKVGKHCMIGSGK